MAKKYLITSALPYVNNIPHLGNLICVISADIYTRFLRLNNKNVTSVLGTDEHGTTAEVRAKEEGITPQQLVNKYFKIHTKIYDWFNCEFDCYGRTSSKDNHEISRDIFKKLYKNKYITKDKVEQFYCKSDKMFLADRYVKGTCTFCGFEDAKGDQCDKCGKLLEELKNPKCALCNKTPELKESTHFFIRLDKLQSFLEKWISKNKQGWSPNALAITNSWLKDGLKPRAISRDLEWGIPLPVKGYEHKVLYSWFDAPIGYISITKECKKDWKKLWFDNKTELVQFMGKDNIPFHTILFPAFLIGAKDDYTLMKTINVNEYLNYEDGKFSKSRGVGVFGNDAINTRIHPDIFRFYMTINRPEKTDTVFSWEDLQEKLNSELVGNYGNLVNRVLTFTNRFYQSKVPKLTKKELKYNSQINKIEKHYSNIELKKAVKEILELSRLGNKYFQDKELWNLIKQNPKKAENVLANLLRLLKDLAILFHPIIPSKSKELQELLMTKQVNWKDLGKPLESKIVLNSRILFTKLEDDKVHELRQEFSGKEVIDELDLRVAKILAVKDHPNANKLYKLRITVGDSERNLIAGLKKHYTKKELINQNIIIVANLKPAKLRGELSEGMLLAASNDKIVSLLTSDEKPGTIVSAGKESQMPKEINIKKVLDAQLKAENGRVYYKHRLLMANSKEITTDKDIIGLVH